MFIPSHLKTSNPLQVFWTNSPSSILSRTKMKTLIHTLVVSHLCRFVRALSRVKSIVIEILKENQLIHILQPGKSSPNNFKYKKIFLGSFRLHYNWCSTSSRVLPAPAPVRDESTLNSTEFSTSVHQHGTGSRGSRSRRFPWSQRTLSGYLQWLEETSHDGESDENEIDKLADLFIANCHEKFILEKQESDRKFQEMLARGL